MAKKYNYTIVKQICKDNGFNLIDKVYKNSNTSMSMVCIECDSLKTTKLSHIISGNGCSNCNGYILHNADEIKDRLAQRNFSLITSSYTRFDEKINVICNVCDYNWFPIASNIYKGSGCPRCSNKEKYTIDYARDLVRNKSGLLLSTKYENVNAQLEVLCNICSTIWHPTLRSLNKKHWCPTCADCKGGKKQKLLISILKEIFPDDQVFSNFKGFDWLVYKKRQEVDIWVPHIKLAIEYDGMQHFKPVKYFGGEIGFKEQQKRDKNKDELIEKHKSDIYFFIRLNYKDNISKDDVMALLINKNIINSPT